MLQPQSQISIVRQFAHLHLWLHARLLALAKAVETLPERNRVVDAHMIAEELLEEEHEPLKNSWFGTFAFSAHCYRKPERLCQFSHQQDVFVICSKRIPTRVRRPSSVQAGAAVPILSKTWTLAEPTLQAPGLCPVALKPWRQNSQTQAKASAVLANANTAPAPVWLLPHVVATLPRGKLPIADRYDLALPSQFLSDGEMENE